MSYTADNPPHYIRPLLEEYPELEVGSCGYRKGAWVEFRDTKTGDSFKFEREITNDITVTHDGFKNGQIRTSVSNADFNNVKERDILIGEALEDELTGYESLAEAVEDAEYK